MIKRSASTIVVKTIAMAMPTDIQISCCVSTSSTLPDTTLVGNSCVYTGVEGGECRSAIVLDAALECEVLMIFSLLLSDGRSRYVVGMGPCCVLVSWILDGVDVGMGPYCVYVAWILDGVDVGWTYFVCNNEGFWRTISLLSVAQWNADSLKRLLSCNEPHTVLEAQKFVRWRISNGN